MIKLINRFLNKLGYATINNDSYWCKYLYDMGYADAIFNQGEQQTTPNIFKQTAKYQSDRILTGCWMDGYNKGIETLQYEVNNDKIDK